MTRVTKPRTAKVRTRKPTAPPKRARTTPVAVTRERWKARGAFDERQRCVRIVLGFGRRVGVSLAFMREIADKLRDSKEDGYGR